MHRIDRIYSVQTVQKPTPPQPGYPTSLASLPAASSRPPTELTYWHSIPKLQTSSVIHQHTPRELLLLYAPHNAPAACHVPETLYAHDLAHVLPLDGLKDCEKAA
jgi:hypothetical protein